MFAIAYLNVLFPIAAAWTSAMVLDGEMAGGRDGTYQSGHVRKFPGEPFVYLAEFAAWMPPAIRPSHVHPTRWPKYENKGESRHRSFGIQAPIVDSKYARHQACLLRRLHYRLFSAEAEG